MTNKGRIFIMGDTHGNFSFLPFFCQAEETTVDDYLIILGDAGINYYKGKKDKKVKDFISKCPVTLICIHGNHEIRPKNISTYKKIMVNEMNCYCWVEDEYPNIIFPEDGVVYLKGLRCLVCGGAYSVDKYYRLEMGYNWFSDEQMSSEDQKRIIQGLTEGDCRFDYIFSHACPLKYEPTFLFMKDFDQSTVDISTPTFLQEVYDIIAHRCPPKAWYYGHYHGDYKYCSEHGVNFCILYDEIEKLPLD